jgi:hypothetical protein
MRYSRGVLAVVIVGLEAEGVGCSTELPEDPHPVQTMETHAANEISD